jgi:hypothetical protein
LRSPTRALALWCTEKAMRSVAILIIMPRSA